MITHITMWSACCGCRLLRIHWCKQEKVVRSNKQAKTYYYYDWYDYYYVVIMSLLCLYYVFRFVRIIC